MLGYAHCVFAQHKETYPDKDNSSKREQQDLFLSHKPVYLFEYEAYDKRN